MLANLFTALAITTSIGMTTPKQPPLKSGVTTQEITYQYETNEVNSLDDLIVGNIYKTKINYYNKTFLTLTNYDEIATKAYNIKTDQNYIGGVSVEDNYETTDNETNKFYADDPTYFSYTIETNIMEKSDNIEFYRYVELRYTFTDANLGLITADIIMNADIKTSLQRYTEDNEDTFENCNFFEKSKYLGEPIVTEVTTEGLYNTIENFIETYLYGNDKLQNTEYTIMGVTYTMSEWLAHTTTIVLISLIVFVLVMFIKWLFKQIGNTFNLVGVY